MIDALVAAHPDDLTRDELGERTGLATSGGTFATYLSRLRSNGLVRDLADGGLQATDVLVRGLGASR
ncbi:MAG: hypothetical protein AAFZ07_20380 [Actinomycetota bacterium]